MAATDRTDYRKEIKQFPDFLDIGLVKSVMKDLFPELSERERHCVFFLAQGLSKGKVCHSLGISDYMIHRVLDDVRVKLSVESVFEIRFVYQSRTNILLLQNCINTRLDILDEVKYFNAESISVIEKKKPDKRLPKIFALDSLI